MNDGMGWLGLITSPSPFRSVFSTSTRSKITDLSIHGSPFTLKSVYGVSVPEAFPGPRGFLPFTKSTDYIPRLLQFIFCFVGLFTPSLSESSQKVRYKFSTKIRTYTRISYWFWSKETYTIFLVYRVDLLLVSSYLTHTTPVPKSFFF